MQEMKPFIHAKSEHVDHLLCACEECRDGRAIIHRIVCGRRETWLLDVTSAKPLYLWEQLIEWFETPYKIPVRYGWRVCAYRNYQTGEYGEMWIF